MKKTEASKMSYYCRDTTLMNDHPDINIEEIEKFDHVETDLTELFEEIKDFNMNEYLNSNIDY